jgi:hypothetical protein
MLLMWLVSFRVPIGVLISYILMYPVSKHGFLQKNQIVAVAKRPFSRILHKPSPRLCRGPHTATEPLNTLLHRFATPLTNAATNSVFAMYWHVFFHVSVP